jgi:hypothetical protein
MGPRQSRASSVGLWLDAERGSDQFTADEALQSLLGRLVAPPPPEGFAARVMAAAAEEGLVRPPARRRWSSSARLVAWSTVGVVASIVALGALWPFLVRQVVRLLNFSVQGFVWIVSGVEGGLDAWSLMAEIGRAVGASLTTPQVTASIVGIELVGVAALYALHRLLSQDKESPQ